MRIQSLAEVLHVLATASKPLNKFQIEKRSKIVGRQTIHNVIASLEKRKWVNVKMLDWRKGRKSEHYSLTNEGREWADLLNPHFASQLRTDARELRPRDLTLALQNLIAAIAKGKGQPNTRTTITLTTDHRGRWKSTKFNREMVDEIKKHDNF